MAISIKSPEADRIARELARMTGESITVAITVSMQERLERLESIEIKKRGLAASLMRIGRHCAALPELDGRSADEILYGEDGLPA